jgi:hypothetical protein
LSVQKITLESEYRRAFLADAFARFGREGSRERFSAPGLTPRSATLRTASIPRATARPRMELREKFFSCLQRAVDLLHSSDATAAKKNKQEEPAMSERTEDMPRNELRLLHKPKWQLVESDWHMIAGNRTVAPPMPNFDTSR